MLKTMKYFFAVTICLCIASHSNAATYYVHEDGGWLVPAACTESSEFSATYQGCGGEIVAASNLGYEQQVVELVNRVREENSLPPLKRVTPLAQAGRYHAADMAQDGYFDHNSYDLIGGTLSLVCSWSNRISSYYAGWAAVSENIAAGYATPEEVMNAWMASSGHRENILRGSTWEIGVGYYTGGSYGRYWVQDFGRRFDVYPLVINREEASTLFRSVVLYIYGDWNETRLRNDNGSWTAWQPFFSSISWTLNAGTGTHTVWVEMRQSGGLTASASDDIYLIDDTPKPPERPSLAPFYQLLFDDHP